MGGGKPVVFSEVHNYRDVVEIVWKIHFLAFKIIHKMALAESFYYVNSVLSIIMSIMSLCLSNENKNTVFPENWCYKNSSFWHFNLCFFLKTTKTPAFVFITEVIWQTFWLNNWQSILDVVERLGYCLFDHSTLDKNNWC